MSRPVPWTKHDGLGAVLRRLMSMNLLGDEVDRLRPTLMRSHLSLPRSLRVALHGVQQAVLVVRHLGQRPGSGRTGAPRVTGSPGRLPPSPACRPRRCTCRTPQPRWQPGPVQALPRVTVKFPFLVLVRLLVWNGQVLVFSHELTSPLVLLHPPQSGYNEAGRTAALPPTRHRRGGRSKRSIGLARTVAGRMPETLSTETVLLGMEAGKQTDSPGGRQYGKQYETFL